MNAMTMFTLRTKPSHVLIMFDLHRVADISTPTWRVSDYLFASSDEGRGHWSEMPSTAKHHPLAPEVPGC